MAVSKSTIRDRFAPRAGGNQSGFVDYVGQIGPGETGGAARNHEQIHVLGQRNLFRMDLQDAEPAVDIGPRDHHAPVEPSGTKQRRVQDVGAVRRRHQNDALIGLEPVHLDQQLVQRLLALIVPAAQSRSPMTAHRVDFIDENDAGSVLLALIEEVAHAAGAHADKHFHEIRAADGEKGDVGFPGDGARQKGLAGSGRAHQQDAFGNAPAQFLKSLRISQKFDDFLQLLLGFIHSGDVLEGDFLLLRRKQASTALAERKGLIPPRLHLPHHEYPEADQEQERRRIQQNIDPGAVGAFLDGDDHAFFAQDSDQIGVIGRNHGFQVGVVLLELALHLAVAVNGDLGNFPLFHAVHELREAEFPFLGGVAGFDNLPQQEGSGQHHYPEYDCLYCGVHCVTPPPCFALS